MSLYVQLVSAAFVVGLSCISSASLATDPDKTVEALRPLLQSVGQVIPAASSCFGHYGQHGKPRIRDLLASRLAYLHNGQNVIAGSCDLTKCQVEIKHSAGEDVGSAIISFEVRSGFVRASTMQCIITP